MLFFVEITLSFVIKKINKIIFNFSFNILNLSLRDRNSKIVYFFIVIKIYKFGEECYLLKIDLYF